MRTANAVANDPFRMYTGSQVVKKQGVGTWVLMAAIVPLLAIDGQAEDLINRHIAGWIETSKDSLYYVTIATKTILFRAPTSIVHFKALPELGLYAVAATSRISSDPALGEAEARWSVYLFDIPRSRALLLDDKVSFNGEGAYEVRDLGFSENGSYLTQFETYWEGSGVTTYDVSRGSRTNEPPVEATQAGPWFYSPQTREEIVDEYTGRVERIPIGGGRIFYRQSATAPPIQSIALSSTAANVRIFQEAGEFLAEHKDGSNLTLHSLNPHRLLAMYPAAKLDQARRMPGALGALLGNTILYDPQTQESETIRDTNGGSPGNPLGWCSNGRCIVYEAGQSLQIFFTAEKRWVKLPYEIDDCLLHDPPHPASAIALDCLSEGKPLVVLIQPGDHSSKLRHEMISPDSMSGRPTHFIWAKTMWSPLRIPDLLEARREQEALTRARDAEIARRQGLTHKGEARARFTREQAAGYVFENRRDMRAILTGLIRTAALILLAIAVTIRGFRFLISGR